MKQKMVLIISIVVGLVALWLSHEYIQSRMRGIEEERQRVLAGVRKVSVLAAARDLPADTVLKMSDLGRKQSYEQDVGRNTVLPEEVDQVIGKKIKFPLSRNDPVLWSIVDVPYRPGSGLAGMVNPGMRAVSVSVGGAASVSGLVQPNDRVDVLGSFLFPSKSGQNEMEVVTLTVLQDVSVLATGQTLGKSLEGLGSDRRRAASTGYSMVTFEVTPREAELLVFAEQMKGRITLTLRNPTDVSFEKDLPEVNFKHIETTLPELNEYRQRVIRHKGKL